MTQHFDFVALGWVEKYLREEMDQALACLKKAVREPGQPGHLTEALQNVHSATGVLRLCTLDPAALLTEEIERTLGQMLDQKIQGEARKLALTEVVAAIESLPAYLANVRAKREVSATVIASTINDLRRFSNRPSLPDSMFFSPRISLAAGITNGAEPSPEDKIEEYGRKAARICYEHSQAALKREHEALKKLYAVGKLGATTLAGTPMEAYFRCYMGLIEVLAQPGTSADEVIVDVFKHCFVFLKSLAHNSNHALVEADPEPYVRKMLYYIARSPSPTSLQQTLRDTFNVHEVGEVRLGSERLIQEDDLLEALRQTLSQLLEVMLFMSTDGEEICSSNSQLSETIVPRLRQVGLQLKALGLDSYSEIILAQHGHLAALADREEPANAVELIDFGGALVAVKEGLEHKLKHGLSARGGSSSHELDIAIAEQTVRCLNDMKSSINREFVRGELLAFKQELALDTAYTRAELRPLYRAQTLIQKEDTLAGLRGLDSGDVPEAATLLVLTDQCLQELPDRGYAQKAIADMEQVLSVLGLVEGREAQVSVLRKCCDYIVASIELGGLVQDAGMACFAEAVAALEHYLERNAEDPLGNADEHLCRAEARAGMLSGFIEQRQATFEDHSELCIDAPTFEEPVPERVDNVVPLERAPSRASDVFWRDALETWGLDTIQRGADAPLEDPDADIDEELVECFVEESRKYLRRLEEAQPRFANELTDESAILEIRAVFHTMKGSARTIELFEFGEFMYQMEKLFNALRDGYVEGAPEMAELVQVVLHRLPGFVEMMSEGIPIYSADFAVPGMIADSMCSKSFDSASTRIDFDGGAISIAESVAPSADSEQEQAQPVVTAVEGNPIEEVAAEVVSVDLDELWSRENAVDILDGLIELFENTAPRDDMGNVCGRALILLRALVPALVELRNGDLLEMDRSVLSHFLDLPVIEQLASNAVFGLVDNGHGEFFKFPLSADVVQELGRYLETLLEEDLESDTDSAAAIHRDVREFIQMTLQLPEVTVRPEQGLGEMPVSELMQFEVTAERPGYELAEVEFNPDLLEASETQDEGEEEPEETGQEFTEEPPEQSPAPLAEVLHYPKSGPEHTPEQLLGLGERAPESQAVTSAVEEIDQELLDLFLETLPEYLEAMDTSASELADRQESALQSLRNTLHTMKGGANSVGVHTFGGLVHDVESRLEPIEMKSLDDAALELVYQVVSELHEASAAMLASRSDWGPEQAEAEDNQAQEELPEQDAPERVDNIRVATGRIDRLLDTGLEVSMGNVRCRRSLDRGAQGQQQVMGLARRVQDLVDKLSLQLDTEIQTRTEEISDTEQFDPLEMDRLTEKQSLAAILREAAFDLHEEARELGEYIGLAMGEAMGLSRLIENSQSELRLLRLVSFSKLGPGFHRLVHQVSRQLGRQVEFEITCEEGGLDVTVFEQLRVALEHMLRNSVDHGIGTPAERRAAGKSETGKISLVIFRRGSEFIIRLIDDGHGLDPERLREKAEQSDLVQGADKLSDEEAMRLIFRSGLSTAEQVTEISGRGVGMDAVYQSVLQMGGNIDVQSKPGFYTQFDICVPASIMVNGALLASIGEEEIAVPLTSLDGSDFRHRDEVHRQARLPRGVLSFRDEDYELHYLGVVRGTLPALRVVEMPEFVPVLFAHHGARRVAFYVDSVTNAEELVIRSLGAQFSGVPGIAGGSLKPDGQPVLALDLNELIRQLNYQESVSEATSVEADDNTLILCVDDSVMMRKTYEKRLRSMGYEVITAIDGEEALDFLSETTRLPDFIFTDLEMPNMNGFDFIANLRRAPVLEDIPTVVVSSRDGEKHRNEAQRVGATDFMAKGSNSAEGMRAVIEQYLGQVAMAG